MDLIAGYDQTDPEQAREIYNRWLAENCSEEGVTIGAVGNIREGVFTPDPGLEEALNPVDTGAVRLPGRIDAKRVAMWVVFAVLIGVGISVGAIVWYEYSEQMRIVRLSEQPVLPASVPAAPDSPAVKVPAAAGSDSSAGESGAPAERIRLPPCLRNSPNRCASRRPFLRQNWFLRLLQCTIT